MRQPDFAKWYFYQLLKKYEGEQLYLNELGYVYGNEEKTGNDSNLLIVFYVQIMPDDFVMQLHRF